VRHSLQSLWMKRHLMYRASFRAKRLQRFGAESSDHMGFRCANGGLVSGKMGDRQAGARKSLWPQGQSERVVAAVA
jgi:hypothetical protein